MASEDPPGPPAPEGGNAPPPHRRRRRRRRGHGAAAAGEPANAPSAEPPSTPGDASHPRGDAPGDVSRPHGSAPRDAWRPHGGGPRDAWRPHGGGPRDAARVDTPRTDRGDRRRGRDRGPRRDRTPQPQAPAPVIPEVSRLAAGAVTAEPLAPAEVTEMKRHLAFIREYKDALRLKLNATEDLLVNGQREPSDRGVCKHLLGKIDRAVVEGAIGREPLRSNAAARARMLEGAIRLTADPSVLLTYLETLTHVRVHADAAQAFGEVAARLDFESMSASRLGRLLQVLIETFSGHERVQVLFSLLAASAFARAFDLALPALPEAVVDAFAPLRAVHRRADAPAGRTTADRGEDHVLRAGVEQLLSAPDPVLRAYSEPLRITILELALEDDVPAELADRAAGVLLSSLPRAERTYAGLAVQRAAQLLARHADDRARAVLEELRRGQPGYRLAERWLAALDARRIGRVALRPGAAELGRLAPGFWLDGQRDVWVRTAPVGDGERVAREAALQRELLLPGVAAVVADGVASGIPYVAVVANGRPLAPRAGGAPIPGAPASDAAISGTADELPLAIALALAAAAMRIFHALTLAGVTLPDAEPERFLYTTPPASALVLADLDGAERTDGTTAAARNATAARRLVRRLVPEDAIRRLPAALATALTAALDPGADLAALTRALDAAALRAPRD